MVAVVAADQAFAVLVPGAAGYVRIQATDSSLLERLDAEGVFDDADARVQWRSFGKQAAREGVQRRQDNEFAQAYEFARFALFVALLTDDQHGVDAVVSNTWTVAQGVRDVLHRGGGPLRDPDAGPEWQEAVERYRRWLEWTEAAIAADAHAVLPKVLPLDDRGLATHRLALLAGDDAAAAAAAERLRGTDASLAAVERLSVADPEELTFGSTGQQPFAAWQRYVDHRDAFLTADNPTQFAARLASVVRHLEFDRLQATSAGGAFGHRLSYAVSVLLQTVGRDLAAMLLRLDRDEEALRLAERLLARSMVDWMGRTHGSWRRARPHLAAIAPLWSGSLNAGDVLDADEIQPAARELDATIVIYLRHAAGVHAWLVPPAGELLSVDLAEPRALLEPVVERLPYLPPRADGAVRDARPSDAAPTGKEELDRCLRELYDALIPFDGAITTERLAIVADPTLNAVPFAALRTPRGSYLVEERDLVSWPSVTTSIMIESSADIPTWMRARRDGPVAPLVMGKSTFASEYEVAGERVRVGPLAGAAAEAARVAALIGAEVKLEEHATLAELMERGSGAVIIHLATHGLLAEDDPTASCLLLSDGVLTAQALYSYDPGIRAGLVVMSACRTGLGGDHPDSLVGLESAFLIAGAKTVVSTLWRIDDEVTAALMVDFYERLAECGDVARAMRLAQLAVLQDPATAHPAFWAAFQVTGRAAMMRE